jgi:hypothetical protein
MLVSSIVVDTVIALGNLVQTVMIWVFVIVSISSVTANVIVAVPGQVGAVHCVLLPIPDAGEKVPAVAVHRNVRGSPSSSIALAPSVMVPLVSIKHLLTERVISPGGVLATLAPLSQPWIERSATKSAIIASR